MDELIHVMEAYSNSDSRFRMQINTTLQSGFISKHFLEGVYVSVAQ